MNQIYHIVLGIIRTPDQLVMISQKHSVLTAYWTIPGGLVEPGELLTSATIREVREESGLEVVELGHLAFLCQLNRPWNQSQLIIYAFEVVEWRGECCVNDPDDDILSAEYVDLELAYARLAQHPSAAIREPLLAYLHNQAPAGASWFYHQNPDRTEKLIDHKHTA